jgi:hypothetical protein
MTTLLEISYVSFMENRISEAHLRYICRGTCYIFVGIGSREHASAVDAWSMVIAVRASTSGTLHKTFMSSYKLI